MKRIRLTTLFKRHRKRPSDPLGHIPAWKDLGCRGIRLHIADASSPRARKGWAEAKQLRPDWRIIP